MNLLTRQVCWSNRLLLTAMSPMIKSLMSGLASDPSHVDTCLIIPELKRVEFMTFHRALFAGENDTQLDFFVLIKVAEILGCELVSAPDLAHQFYYIIS